MNQVLQPATLEALNRLRTEFELYARAALKLRSKSGAILPLNLNRAQRYVHGQLEQQRTLTGKIRALVLKGRQQGCSTYVEARFFWRTVWAQGVRTFILTHEDVATANLFEMVQRFLHHLPPELRPSVNAQNAKELLFEALDSGYKVGTAGNKSVGRSATVQLFHGSEVAFWPNAQEHAAGVLQTVPNDPGTEVILESTANGIGNFFHEQWQLATRGESEYRAIFVPWYWQDEYARPVEEFSPSVEDRDYQSAYQLRDEQLAWRHFKLIEIGETRFQQEYPANAIEAFQTSGTDSLIAPDIILRARKDKTAAEQGPLLIGVDPARFGDDRTSIIRRRGRVARELESHSKKDTMEVAGMVVRIILKEQPARVFIDVGGLGAGVVDRLRELGYGDTVEAVNFGEKALEPDKYRNKRAECWGQMKAWLTESPARIPDSDSLHADLMAPGYKFDSNSRLQLEDKADIKRRGLASPDEADALALTFASAVNPAQTNYDPYSAFRRQA